MIRYVKAGKGLVPGAIFVIAFSVAAALVFSYFLCDFEIYTDSCYYRVFLADAAVFFPYLFFFSYLFFLMVYASVSLPFQKADPSVLLNRIFAAAFFGIVFSLLSFFVLIPIGNGAKETARFRASVAADSLTKMTEAFKNQNYEEALNFLKIYQTVDKSDAARFSSPDENISFAFEHRRIRNFPHKTYWLNSENLTGELETLIAARRPVPVQTTDNDYALKKLAYEKYSFGKENRYYRPIAEAYAIFRHLSELFPDDPEIGLHMKRAEEEIRRFVLVKDRIREESIFPLSRNIEFVNFDNETGRQLIAAKKLISLTGRNLVEDVKVETRYADGRKSLLFAEYGRIENGRILFDSVWLSDPVNIETGRFAEGAADEAVSEHAVPLFVPPSLLPLLDTEAHGSDTIPLVDLIRLTQAVPAESGRLAVYEREIAVRLIQAVFVLLAPFFVLQVGFRLAPETAPGGKTLVFRLPVIAAAFSLFFFAVYFITGVTAAACVLFFSPLRFIVALTVTAAAALVLFTGGFVFSFARRMFRD